MTKCAMTKSSMVTISRATIKVVATQKVVIPTILKPMTKLKYSYVHIGLEVKNMAKVITELITESVETSTTTERKVITIPAKKFPEAVRILNAMETWSVKKGKNTIKIPYRKNLEKLLKNLEAELIALEQQYFDLKDQHEKA